MRGFAVAISAILLLLCCVSTSADASWLMIRVDQEDVATCPDGLKPASIKDKDDAIAVCVPEETAIEEADPSADSESTPGEDKKPHTGPYEGTPIGDPQFN